MITRKGTKNVAVKLGSVPLPAEELKSAYAGKDVKLTLLYGDIYIAFSYDSDLIQVIRTFPSRKVHRNF